jgi:hypothetical protein
LVVEETSDEVDSKAESFSSVTIAFRKDAKDFEFAEGMFYHYPLSR